MRACVIDKELTATSSDDLCCVVCSVFDVEMSAENCDLHCKHST